jgi:hypothetical protein
MAPATEVLPAMAVGLAFTAFGAVKVYGLVNGIEGGGKKRLQQRVCGS